MKKIAISLLALTLAVFLAAPAMAEFEPYGSVRIGTFWKNVDRADDDADDDSDLVMPLGDFSHFGAKFTTGDLGGRVELGLAGDEDHNAVHIDLLYGTWDYGGGTIKVGQDYTPYIFKSAQVAPGTMDLENYFIGYGCLWDSWQPQIELKLENGFYVALIQPEAEVSSAMKNNIRGYVLAEAVADGDVDPDDEGDMMVFDLLFDELIDDELDIDTTLPKICVGYDFKTEGLCLNPGFAYNTYNIEVGDDIDESITSYLLYVNAKVPLDMVDLQGSVHYGQNLGDFGLAGREAAAYALFDGDNNVEDSTCYGGYIQAAFKVDPATITIGYGYAQSENDEAGDDADQQQSYFVNAKIPIADTFFVVPEYSYYDQMDNAAGNEEDDTWYFGLKWQMDF